MWTHLQGYDIMLASQSPRRQELLAQLDLPFRVFTLSDIDESYPPSLPVSEVPAYIAGRKAAAYQPYLSARSMLITADTMVVVGDKILGKPRDTAEACHMLRLLSGRVHQVVTAVSICYQGQQRLFSVTTEVHFSPLTTAQIQYYVTHYHPLDKAGAYGIQEWIGMVAVTKLQGSFFNVMGLPVQRLYQELQLIPAYTE